MISDPTSVGFEVTLDRYVERAQKPAKKHHHIPQLYLSGFSNSGEKNGLLTVIIVLRLVCSGSRLGHHGASWEVDEFFDSLAHSSRKYFYFFRRIVRSAKGVGDLLVRQSREKRADPTRVIYCDVIENVAIPT